MRRASAANVQAANETAKDLRKLAAAENIRNAFFSRACGLGNTPVFMVING